MAVVVTEIDRIPTQIVEGFGHLGVATVHEAYGRRGLLAPRLRPIYQPVNIAGTAVTCEVAPGDNWMIHVAVEHCRPGDILVVSPTSSCDNGYFGDLVADGLRARGVRGVIIDAGVRDVAALTEMRFPVWSKCISAQATVKETLGNINCPMVCAGQLIRPGDLIVADSDGVVTVRRADAADVLAKSSQREERDAEVRRRLQAGELTVDILGLRAGLQSKGLRIVRRLDKP